MYFLRPLRSLSFYTTCKGRLHHIMQTLPHNLALCKRIVGQLVPFEFVLLNYNSPDNLHEWVHEHCQEALNYGILRYVRTDVPTFFNASIAKNIAARCSRYDVLVNVDSDNFLSTFYLSALLSWRSQSTLEVDTNPPYYVRCTRGRIAMERDHFYALGGYDEELANHWGGEDDDLVARSALMGNAMRRIPAPLIGPIIQHGDEDRIAFLENPIINSDNPIRKTAENLKAGRVVANEGRPWGILPEWG